MFLDFLFFWHLVNIVGWFQFREKRKYCSFVPPFFIVSALKTSKFSTLKKFVTCFFFHVFVLEVFPLPFSSSSFLASLLFLSLAAALPQLPPHFRPTFHSLGTRLRQRQPPHSSGLLRFIPAYNAGAELKCCKTNCTDSLLFHARETPADFLSLL